VFAAFALASCAAPELAVGKPAAPDMSAVVAAYENPTAVLDTATLQSAVSLATTRATLVAATDVYRRLTGGIEQASQAYNEKHPPSGSGPTFEASGYLSVTRICDGWATSPSPDPANGTLGLTVGFTQQGIDPVIWGGFERCLYRVGQSQILLANAPGPDAGVRAYVGAALSFSAITASPIIVALGVHAELDGSAEDAVFDVRLGGPSGPVELRIPATGGQVIASVAADQSLSFRAANGTFSCDLPTKTCTSDAGIELSY
jgi:hypothetical protein